MRERICAAARDAEIGAVGFVRARIFSELSEKLAGERTPMVPSADERINPFLIMEEAKTIIACLFPYPKGVRTNISDYAKGEDYHLSAQKKLEKICSALRENGFSAIALCDSNPLCERYLAYLAGLGFIGKNRALINPKFGSYIFIGTVLTDAVIEESAPLSQKCAECGACVRACPGGALTEDGFAAERCASYLTQKKGSLTPEERAVIKRSGYAWGCDICQRICPHNAAVANDGNDFTLTRTMAESNRDFRRKYSGRAFSWRGFEVIKRNLDILESE